MFGIFQFSARYARKSSNNGSAVHLSTQAFEIRRHRPFLDPADLMNDSNSLDPYAIIFEESTFLLLRHVPSAYRSDFLSGLRDSLAIPSVISARSGDVPPFYASGYSIGSLLRRRLDKHDTAVQRSRSSLDPQEV